MNSFIKKSFVFFLIFYIFIFSISFPKITYKAYAEDGYYRVISDGVMFYSSPSKSDALFELPVSYYVKKIGESADFLHVECYGANQLTPLLDGYVLKADVTKSNAINPYLSFTVTTAKSAVLYEDSSLLSPLQYVFKSRTLGYYGQVKQADGSYAYYVTYNNKIGYVKEEDLLPFNVPLHETPLTESSAQEDLTSVFETKSEKSTNGLKIFVIVAIIIASIIILALIVIPERKNKAYEID